MTNKYLLVGSPLVHFGWELWVAVFVCDKKDNCSRNPANEYTQIIAAGQTKTPGYDNAGNLTLDAKGYTYAYDYENRLTQIKNPSQTVLATYTYDALGRQVKKVAGTTNTWFYYDGWRMLTEVTGAAQRNYAYGNALDEVLCRSDVVDTTTTDYYMVQDHLNSVVAMLNSTGTVAERYEYDAYGAQRVYDAGFNARSSSSYTQTIAFTGQRLDTLDAGALAVMYYKNRYYDPDTGRFLSRDPLGIMPGGYEGNRKFKPSMQYQDGMSTYEYVKNNPLSHLDILGLENSMGYPETLGGCAQKGMEALGGLAKEYLLSHWCSTSKTIDNKPVCKDGKKAYLYREWVEWQLYQTEFPPTGGIWGPYIDKNRGEDPPARCFRKTTVYDYVCRCPCPPGMDWVIIRSYSADTSEYKVQNTFEDGSIEKYWTVNKMWQYGCRKPYSPPFNPFGFGCPH